jgi:hypothetical protein
MKEKLDLILSDFSSDVTEDMNFWRFDIFELNRDEFPVPDLVLILLRNIMKFPWSGRFEKEKWAVHCKFKGIPLSFAQRKFGFCIRYQKETPPDVNGALTQLKTALPIVEKLLEDHAQVQGKQGDVTLANLFHELDRRYHFFREKAKEAYAQNNPIGIPEKLSETTTVWRGINQGLREGFHYTLAMIDNYFSRLEHVCILIQPFIGFDPKEGALVKLIRSNWSDKFKSVFNIGQEPTAKKLYDHLVEMKESFRNPNAHGGFEKGWWSLYFHFPNVGAIPASLLNFPKSLQFKLTPPQTESYDEICLLLDAVDALFDSEKTKMGMEFIKSGIEVAFDQESRKKYTQATQSPVIFSKFLEKEIYLDDVERNMDF